LGGRLRDLGGSGERIQRQEVVSGFGRTHCYGLIKGGIDERSSDSGVCVPFDAGLEDCETGGESLSFAIVVAGSSYWI